MTEAVRAYLGLGANLGDRLRNLQRAVDHLQTSPGVRVTGSSRVYQTEPVGPPQPMYLNAVVEATTTLRPRQLLDACLEVERVLGRVRGPRWGPRAIDVDLLTYGSRSIAEPGLTVPHPRMAERAFVLVPLAELDQDPPLPGGRRLADLRLGTEAATAVRVYASPLSLERATRSADRPAADPDH